MGLADIFSDISAFSNPFGAPSSGQWNLSKGVYTQKANPKNSVIFFYETKSPDPAVRTGADQIADSGGRRIAEYNYPYRDGVALADLGRKGETYTFNIKFYGTNYQQLLQQFLNIVLNDSGGGTLLHPVRSAMPAGGIPVRFVDYEFVHRYDEWNAVTIKAIFREDQTVTLANANIPAASQDSALRSALQTLTNVQSTIQQGIFEVGALLLLPNAIKSAMEQRLNSITNAVSMLLGQISATFSSNAQIQQLAANAVNIAGGVTAVSSGTTTTANLPPVYQVGFDTATQASIQANLAAYIAASQITPSQAVFAANQARAQITDAIFQIDEEMGNSGYAIIVSYRGLSNAIQFAVQAAIATAQSLVVLYTVPYKMSLRMVAYNNGLTADDQNLLVSLNPYLSSINVIEKGTIVTVPVSS
jgi:prophage DNA circulation protein